MIPAGLFRAVAKYTDESKPRVGEGGSGREGKGHHILHPRHVQHPPARPAYHSLPPSMMMSPGSMYLSSCSMVESTGAPALTRMITRLCLAAQGGAQELFELELHGREFEGAQSRSRRSGSRAAMNSSCALRASPPFPFPLRARLGPQHLGISFCFCHCPFQSAISPLWRWAHLGRSREATKSFKSS